VNSLQYIGSSKIGTIRSKPNVKYPMIRLPQECSEIIGQRAHVYKTSHDGQPAFLVVPYIQESAQAMTARLTVGQFRAAVNHKKPVVDVLPEQDKIRMQHYCPLHPQVVSAVRPLLDGRRDDELMFRQLSFERWLKKQKIQLSYCDGHFVPGDLRKFCEQQGDILQWEQSNKNYILTHGVSGVDWRFYKHPLPENVFDVYMQYWKETKF
jgi:hypothetical protein